MFFLKIIETEKKKSSEYVFLRGVYVGVRDIQRSYKFSWPAGPWPPGGAAPLCAPGDAHTKSPASPLFIYLYTPIRRYKTGAAQEYPALSGSAPSPLPPRASPRRSSAAASAAAVRFRSSRHRRVRTSVECPQIRRLALRLPEG